MATTQANQAIYDRLNGMQQFHPGNVTLLTDWSIEPGDVIQVQSGTDANGDAVFSPMPVYQLDMTWRGAVTAEVQATGNEKRPPLSALRRQNYSYGHGISQAQKTADEAVDEVIYISDFTKTDRGIGMLAQAIGVAIETDEENPNYGKPKVVDGKYQFDANGATLTGQINLAAGHVETVATQAQADATEALGKIDVQAGRIDLVVSTTEQGSVIKSASIVAAINNNTQQSEVSLNADRVKIDGTAGVYLNGVLFRRNNENTLDVNIAKTGKLQVGTSTNTGDTDIYGSVDFYGTNSQITFQNGFRLGNSSPYKTIDSTFNPLVAVQVSGPTDNVYTLQYKRLTDSEFQNGSTFSRAVSQLDGVWSGGNTLTVTALPQNQSFQLDVLSYTVGTFSTTTHRALVTIRSQLVTAAAQDPNAYLKQLTIDASDVYERGWRAAQDKLVWPGDGSGLSALIKYPDWGAAASSTSGTTADQSAKMVLLTDNSASSKVECRIGGTKVAECPYTGGPTVTDVGLYTSTSGGTQVRSFQTNDTRTFYPVATLSDASTVHGDGIVGTSVSAGTYYPVATLSDGSTVSGDSVTVTVPATYPYSCIVDRRDIPSTNRSGTGVYMKVASRVGETDPSSIRTVRVGAFDEAIYETRKNIGTSSKTVYWGSNYSKSTTFGRIYVGSKDEYINGGYRQDNNLYYLTTSNTYAAISGTFTNVIRNRTSGDPVPNGTTVYYD